nr:MAG TPA: hypothetical protein [Caudoviricetes sp.]
MLFSLQPHILLRPHHKLFKLQIFSLSCSPFCFCSLYCLHLYNNIGAELCQPLFVLFLY